MSGRYHRTYSRKKASAPPISQFDKLITECGKSTHPVAAKTAGHVGKWGMTSFTSLRSINGGKEYVGKRSHGNTATTPSEDPFSFEGDKGEAKKTASKRRKFFKSREAALSPEPPDKGEIDSFKSSEENSQSSNNGKDLNKGMKEALKPAGGIKLKIFKSRNNDSYSTDTYSSSVQLPSDDTSSNSSNSPINPASPSTLHVENKFCENDSGCDDKISGCQSQKVDAPLPTIDEVINENSQSPTQPVLSCDSGIKCETNLCSDSTKLIESISSTLSSLSHSVHDEKVKDSYSEPIKSLRNKTNKAENLRNNKKRRRPSKNDTKPEKIPSPVDMNLFSTDFDENEIIDRTSIDYTTSTDINSETDLFSDLPLSRSDTIDLNDICLSSKETPLSSQERLTKITDEEVNSNHEDLNDKNCISKKKSIFKSRQKEGENKKRATYRHKWHGNEEKDSKKDQLEKTQSTHYDNVSEDPFQFGSLPALTRTQTWPSNSSQSREPFPDFDEDSSITSVKCTKPVKKFYTVVKNVKKTHQLQESGEFQEFNDDVDYFLDALKNTNTAGMRCLASLNLAQKCMVPAFRMHLRAHATVTKFFRALLDAPSHPYLAECAAMVMFALSQDRLNMDLDRCSLELMLNLLDADANTGDVNSTSDVTSVDHANKIKSLCKELQLQGHAKHLKLDNINAGTLAMETLLSLTSKRAGEWFKEELRELGGVDHLVRTVTSNANPLNVNTQSWSSTSLEKLSRIDRCLKVLENVSHQNESNQEYLLTINKGDFAKTLMKLFWLCHREIPLNPETGGSNPDIHKSFVTTLITTMKVLINLTHGSIKEALGSKLLGKDQEIYTLSMSCLLKMPEYLNHDTKFEIQVLSCCLMLNLVEKSKGNRNFLMTLKVPDDETKDSDDLFITAGSQKTTIAALVELFYLCEASAREQEAHTDNIIEHDLDQDAREEEKKDEEIEETVARLLQKAGRHMEDTLIAAYTALLSGYCLLDNKDFEVEIRELQPEKHFKTMVTVLKKFLHFMNLTATTSLLRSLKPTEQVVKFMESLDKDPEEEAKELQLKKEKERANAIAFDAFGF